MVKIHDFGDLGIPVPEFQFASVRSFLDIPLILTGMEQTEDEYGENTLIHAVIIHNSTPITLRTQSEYLTAQCKAISDVGGFPVPVVIKSYGRSYTLTRYEKKRGENLEKVLEKAYQQKIPGLDE